MADWLRPFKIPPIPKDLEKTWAEFERERLDTKMKAEEIHREMATLMTYDVGMGRTPRINRIGQDGNAVTGVGWPVESHITAEGRLHNDNGPALRYADGKTFWFLNGVQVNEKIVKGEITRKDILNADNQEVRRIMIEQVGPRKFRRMFKPKVLKIDQYGKLVEFPDIRDEQNPKWMELERSLMHEMMMKTMLFPQRESRKERKEREKREEEQAKAVQKRDKVEQFLPYLAVHVTDPSTEREYYLRVPPDFRNKTPRAAIAWTFGLKEEDYNPLQEA